MKIIPNFLFENNYKVMTFLVQIINDQSKCVHTTFKSKLAKTIATSFKCAQTLNSMVFVAIVRSTCSTR
jgi:hypothetical protein